MEDYVIIIGAMKSGTTTLFQKLAAHSKIAPARPKEPGFFAFEEIHARGFDWYHGLFDFDPARHRYRLEASTDYTKAPFVTGVWERMVAHEGARFKLIYIMRHPLRRLESHARHVQRTRKELGQIVSERPGHGFEHGLSPASLAMSSYAYQLAAYEMPWRTGDLFVTTLEELESDPDRVMTEVCAFLGLEHESRMETDTVFNPGRRAKTEPTALGRLAARPAALAAGKMLLPGGLRARLKGLMAREVPVEGRFRLAPVEEEILGRLLAPDLARLHGEYGVDVARIWQMKTG
jgi:hypothetical protein